ncbi:MAG: arsenate reductase family protein [Lachnospiraceae bacterium]|nr:arsenate reductase family protein [Lachnospiraceae bacterium]
MLFIWYPKCSTCKKAQKWLDEHSIEYEERHIAEDHPSYDELKDRLPAMNEDEQLKLLATNGMLVKRPLLTDGDTVLVGFREAEWNDKWN